MDGKANRRKNKYGYIDPTVDADQQYIDCVCQVSCCPILYYITLSHDFANLTAQNFVINNQNLDKFVAQFNFAKIIINCVYIYQKVGNNFWCHFKQLAASLIESVSVGLLNIYITIERVFIITNQNSRQQNVSLTFFTGFFSKNLTQLIPIK